MIKGCSSGTSDLSCKWLLSEWLERSTGFMVLSSSTSTPECLKNGSTDVRSEVGMGTSLGGTYLIIKTETATVVNASNVPTLTCIPRTKNITTVKVNNLRKMLQPRYCTTKLTIPANWETSIKNARTAAKRPVTIVLFKGTCVRLWISEKKEGNKPSLAIAIKTRGCKTRVPMGRYIYHMQTTITIPSINVHEHIYVYLSYFNNTF